MTSRQIRETTPPQAKSHVFIRLLKHTNIGTVHFDGHPIVLRHKL